MLSESVARNKGIDIMNVMNLIDFSIPVLVKGKMRIGNNYDGGYVVYDGLLHENRSIDILWCWLDTAFGEHFHQLTGNEVLMFDPTMCRGRFLLDFHYLVGLGAQFKFRESLSYLSKTLFGSGNVKALRCCFKCTRFFYA